MAVLLVVSASLLAGWVSYHVIEKPTGKLRMLRDREGRPRDYYPDLARTGGG
jgi:peptidoglycan/LPS O-acetylase OafA/YrhL